MKTAAAAVAAVLLSSVSPLGAAWADVTFDIQSASSDGAEESSRGYVSGLNLRMGVFEADAGADAAMFGEMIFLGEDAPPVMIAVDHEGRRHFRDDSMPMMGGGGGAPGLPGGMPGGLPAGMPDLGALLDDALADLSDEERDAVMGALPGLGAGPAAAPSAPTVAPLTADLGLSAPAGALGSNLTPYEVMANGVRESVVWTADPSSVPGGDEVVTAFSAMSEHLAARVGQMGLGDTNVMLDVDNLDGRLPVATQELSSSGAVTFETWLSATDTSALPADTFTPPYEAATMSDLMNGR